MTAPAQHPQPVLTFAAEVAAKFAAHAAGQPEDQLRGPTERLLAAIGTAQGLAVVAKDESPLPDPPGRPVDCGRRPQAAARPHGSPACR